MPPRLRGLLRLVAATLIAVVGLALAFVVAPAQASGEPTSEHGFTNAVGISLS